MRKKVSTTRKSGRLDLTLATSDQILSDLTKAIPAGSGSFTEQYLAVEVFSKYLDPRESAEDRRSRGIEKFLKMELRNARTNVRLFMAQDPTTPFEEHAGRVMDTARRYISNLLGEPEIAWNFQMTHGASTRIKKSGVAAFAKYEGKAHITLSALPLWLDAISDTRLANEEGLVYPTIVDGSVLFTVPKQSDIDRVACKEPELNMILQRSIGLAIERKLARIGIDLHDQTRNQRLAQIGARDKSLATIDLSSASDTISHEVVRQLLPDAWYTMLDAVRCKYTDIDGHVHELSMFSSMGNGFTFQLETLIFWAMAASVQYHTRGKGPIAVYGDDIIVTTSTARRLLPILSFLGFIPNVKKTHINGSFRESCGKHFYRTTDVTPFYVRAPFAHITDLIKTLNQVRAWILRNPATDTSDSLYQFWKKWKKTVPSYLFGGRDLSDTGSLVTLDRPRKRLTEVPMVIRKRKQPGDDKKTGLKRKLKIRLHRSEYGAYLFWHCTRKNDPVETDNVMYTRWVVRPSHHGDWYEGAQILWQECHEICPSGGASHDVLAL